MLPIPFQMLRQRISTAVPSNNNSVLVNGRFANLNLLPIRLQLDSLGTWYPLHSFKNSPTVTICIEVHIEFLNSTEGIWYPRQWLIRHHSFMFYRLMEAVLSAALTTPDRASLMVEFCRYLCLALPHDPMQPRIDPYGQQSPLYQLLMRHNNPAVIRPTPLYPVNFSSNTTSNTEVSQPQV